MRAALGDFLRAGAEAGYRHHHLDIDPVFVRAALTDKGDIVIQQAFHAGGRRGLVDKELEAHLDMTAFGIEQIGHFGEHGLERFDRDFPLVVIENFHETRHVRALEIMRQVHVHIEIGNGVLNHAGAVLYLYRMIDILDAHLVDGNGAGIGRVLHIGQAGGFAFGFINDFTHHSFSSL